MAVLIDEKTPVKDKESGFHRRIFMLAEQAMAMSAGRTPDPRDRKLIPANESFKGLVQFK